ncbi:heavy metal translocating P-type ATPase [Mechercharimyces sp. CAU 1602]|uniref:heavy metal translocating P-type ATPase n=1 Tax=Mechercharimyces sp. CAU 1602 TaxID=2973933 RepID=UPI0021613CCD|nr:heavy metal translocating P-type ATPase [Mechercharimyces sp. CAU 1602]MCS1350595.1 heavy metal translocating P-type ATPase [Mechercharimyces sp. CAU 1602]
MSSTYKLENLSCAHCASKFEDNVNNIEGVKKATVYFGSLKLRVEGEASLAELNEAGKFDGIKVVEEKQIGNERKKAWDPTTVRVASSTFLLILGAVLEGTALTPTIVAIVLYGVAALTGGYTMFIRGLRNLPRLQFDMNVLMTIAVIGAALIGEWREGAVVAVLFAFSELLEKASMDRARRSIQSVMDLAPRTALVIRNGEEVTLSVEEIAVGDRVLVRPGEKIPVDGIVLSGKSMVNQAAITGESVPVGKENGSDVFAGTLNQRGALEIEVTKRVEDTTISKIIRLVEESQAEQAPAQAFVDRFAQWYTPLVMGLAVLIALLPPLLLSAAWEEWIYRALTLLVVACPCALVISTPVTILSAIGNAAKHGVLVKGGIYLEQLASLQAIAFDKTGTLTHGEPEVTDRITFGGMDEKLLVQRAAAVERLSEHPLARAVVHDAKHRNYPLLTSANFEAFTGKGARAEVEGGEVYVGSPTWFTSFNVVTSEMNALADQLRAEGKTVIMVGTREQVDGMLALADRLRDESVTTVSQLHQAGIKELAMLTGDHEETANAIAKQVGIDGVYAELLPDEKVKQVKALTKKYGHVGMIGDGVNDAPALSTATVGIAMGAAGSDTALETADIVLMGDDLTRLPFAIRLGKKAMTVVKQNITFALVTKLLAVLLVFPGILTLWIAIAADMGATLLVTLNGMRLFRHK